MIHIDIEYTCDECQEWVSFGEYLEQHCIHCAELAEQALIEAAMEEGQ